MYFFQEVGVVVWGSFALLAASVSSTWRVCSVKPWPTWEMKRIRSGGLGVAIASCTCKTYFMELVASTNGHQCIHDPKTGVVVPALLLTDQGLWFQELYGTYMNCSRSQHHSPSQLQKGSCFCSCGDPQILGERICAGSWTLVLEQSKDRLALCYRSNESLPWAEPRLCCMSLALLQISMNQCIRTPMYKCGPFP